MPDYVLTEELAMTYLNLYTCGHAQKILSDEKIKPKFLETIKIINDFIPVLFEVVEFLFFRLDDTTKAEMIGLVMGNVFNDLPAQIMKMSKAVGGEKNA